MKSYFYKQLYQQKSVTINSIHFTKYTYHQMGDKRAFSKIINGFLVQVQLNSAQPSELSFILIQNIQQRNLQLKFGNESMPQQLRTLFNNVNELYQHLSLYQNDRRFFDIFPQGSIKVVKQVKYNNVIDVRTLQLTTYPVQKDLQIEKEDQLPQHPENMCDSQMNDENIDLGGNNLYGTQTSQLSLSSHISQKPMRNINQICDKALMMIRKGTNQYIIARALKIKHSSVQKMMMQVKLYGMIYPPRVQQNQYNFHHQSPYYAQEQNNNDFIHFQPNQQYYNMNQNQNQQAWSQAPHRQLGPVTPNMKMHGDGVRQIKKILFTLVKQGKMQSLDQMRNYLLERNIDRSLSSIYRYISSIKAENPEFQGRNYTMYRKEMENQSQYKN